MAVKTITIDMEAYDLLSHHKREGQSFSQVIKAHFGERPTAGRLLARIRSGQLNAPMGKDAVAAIKQLIRDRKLEPARNPRDAKL
jgi:predicted CopG family antitoxin